MAKGKGKDKGESKKSKGKGKEQAIDWSKYPPEVTEIPNPNFVFGTDKFVFKNGDKYEGDFCAHISGLVWREGLGTYITKDGHMYRGTWENDKLLKSEETYVLYPDGTEYNGGIEAGKYSGTGTYIPRKDFYITSKYTANKPIGEVLLIDPNFNQWKGEVTNGEEILLLPENHFYTNLSYEKGIGKEIPLDIIEGEEDTTPKSKITVKSSRDSIKKFQELIFKKSEKTLNDFKETLLDEETIQNIENERNEKERMVKPKLSFLKARSGSNKSLLETFWNRGYRNSNEPLKTFHPTLDMEKIEKLKEQEFKMKIIQEGEIEQ